MITLLEDEQFVRKPGERGRSVINGFYRCMYIYTLLENGVYEYRTAVVG